MSTLAPRRPGARQRGRTLSAPSLLDELGGEPTLDELLVGVWEGLVAQRQVACPMCGAELVPEYAAHVRPVGGRCYGCETVIR